MSSSVEEDNLELLRKTAVQLAERSQTLEDIEKAASVSKLLAERDKALADARNQSHLISFEYWKSLATVVVPLLTLVTLAVTVWMQGAQLSAVREANHDLQWRETVKMVLGQVESKQLIEPPKGNATGQHEAENGKKNGIQNATQPNEDSQRSSGQQDPVLATTLLKAYVLDEKYGKDAIDLGLLMLSRIPNADVFKDFYDSMHITVDWNNLDRIVAANRNIWTQEAALSKAYEDLIKHPRAGQPAPYPVIHYFSLVEEETFLDEKMAQVFRSERPVSYALDLSRFFFLQCDLSESTLAKANLTGTRFETVKLSNANLVDITEFQDSAWVDANWWDAKAVSPKLLLYLIDHAGPMKEISYDEPPPSQAVYMQKLKRLCELAKITCPSKMPYTWVGTNAPQSGK